MCSFTLPVEWLLRLGCVSGGGLSSGTFFQTQDHADQAMMAVYSLMTDQDAFGRQFGFDCLGTVGSGYDGPAYPNIGRGTYTASESAISGKF